MIFKNSTILRIILIISYLLNEIIAKECDHGDIRPDLIDCVKYDTCVYGTWIKTVCVDGYYFEPSQGGCTYDDGTCANVRTTTEDPNTTTVTPEPTEENPETTGNSHFTEEIPTTNPHSEPTEENSSINSDPTEENQTTVPNSSTDESPITNPNSTEESPTTNSSPTEENPITNSNPTDESPTTNEENSTTNDGSSEPSTEAPEACSSGSIKEDESDCHNYQICVREKWYVGQCPLGTYFKNDLKVCIKNDGSCEEKEPTIPDEICKENALHFDVVNCANYFTCENNYWTLRFCEPSKFFDKELQKCVVDEEEQCKLIRKPEEETKDF